MGILERFVKIVFGRSVNSFVVGLSLLFYIFFFVLCLGVYIRIILFWILNFDFISPLKEFIYIYIHQVKIHLFCIYKSFFSSTLCLVICSCIEQVNYRKISPDYYLFLNLYHNLLDCKNIICEPLSFALVKTFFSWKYIHKTRFSSQCDF